MVINLNLRDRLIKAAVQLNDVHPFFAHMVLHLNDGGEIDFDERVPTAGIDARGHLRVNEKWADQFDYQYLMGLLAHEVGHLAFGHLFRLGRRIPSVFNLANDIEINNMLLKNGMKLPADGLLPQNDEISLYGGKVVIKNISEKHSEELYDELYRKLEENNLIEHITVSGYGTGQGKDGNKGTPKSFDSHEYGDSLPDKAKEKNIEKWKDITASAANLARQKGSIPAGMARILDKILNPHMKWRGLLIKYLQNSLLYDYTWKTPSKKSYGLGIYMPGPLKENIEVVFHFDTSGSMDDKELAAGVEECISIGRSFANVSINILMCDAEVHEHYTLKNDDIPKLRTMKMSGRGGTSHRPVVEFVNEKIPKAKVLISFTDGYSDIQDCYKELVPTCDKIIVLTGHAVPNADMEPFGKVIRMEKEDE